MGYTQLERGSVLLLFVDAQSESTPGQGRVYGQVGVYFVDIRKNVVGVSRISGFSQFTGSSRFRVR